MFSGTVISHFGDILRSPRSPDLNISDLLFIGVPEIRCLLSQNLHMERIGEGHQRKEVVIIACEMMTNFNFMKYLEKSIQED